MLIIRSEQMNVFRRAALRSFEDDMLRRLHRLAPTHCDGIGDDRVREVIRLGIDRAARYAFTRRGPVRFYLELMFMFGSDFDTDPQWPAWAASLLGNGSKTDQMARAGRLHRGLKDFLARVSGPGNVYAHDAVRRFRRVAGEPLPYAAHEFEQGLLRQMEEIYPQRVDYVGRESLTTLIAEGVAVADRHGLTTLRGRALSCLLMFELGHGCFEDRLYPWIGSTLAERPAADADQRTRRLEGRTRAYMELIARRIGQA